MLVSVLTHSLLPPPNMELCKFALCFGVSPKRQRVQELCVGHCSGGCPGTLLHRVGEASTARTPGTAGTRLPKIPEVLAQDRALPAMLGLVGAGAGRAPPQVPQLSPSASCSDFFQTCLSPTAAKGFSPAWR